MDEFPPNSDRVKKGPPQAPKEEKKIEQVTEGEVIRKKKSLSKQFRETFIAGDAKNAAHYAVFSVMIPAAKDMIADAGSQGLERLIFGESKSGRRRPPASASPFGRVAYNRYSTPTSEADDRRAMSKRARATHDFDEIILISRTEAETVIDRLFDLVSQYGSASVADLYELVGIESTHTDMKWGWTDVRGAGVSKVRNGYFLDLPDPEPLG